MRKEHTDLFLVLELGDSCNNNCIFCSAAKKKPLSTKEAMRKIYDAKKKGFQNIQFCGGEPTIRGDIIKLVKFSKKLKFQVIGMTTNARMLSYVELTKKLIDGGCNYFAVSLHGHNSKISEACTRTPHSFKQTVSGMKNLLKYKKEGVSVKINFLMNQINIKYLKDFVDWINQEFKTVDSISLLDMDLTGEAAKHPNLMFDLKEYKEIIAAAINSSKIRIGVLNLPFCSITNTKNINKKQAFYNSSNPDLNSPENNLDYLKTKFSFCKFCNFNNICAGVWKEYLKKYGSEGFAPITKNEKRI